MSLLDESTDENIPRRVVWVGGAARSGKTTVTKWLEEHHGFVRYYGDGGAIVTNDEGSHVSFAFQGEILC